MKSFQFNSSLSKILLGSSFILAFAVASANAVVTAWDLNPTNQNGNVGSAIHTFSQAGYNLTVRGYDETSVAGVDTICGLVETPSNELTLDGNGDIAHYLQFDLRSIPPASFSNGMASLQSGESNVLFGSNSLGMRGTQLGGSYAGLAFENQVAIPDFGSYQLISNAASPGRVPPVAFQASITPIPEMSVFFPAVGLLVAVSSTQILRRRRAARLGDLKM